jgi:nucleoside-diphosphate-sugar epimerase
MTILITGGDSRLAHAFAAALAPIAEIRLFDPTFTTPAPAGTTPIAGDLCDPATVTAALTGVDAIVHLAPYLVQRGHQPAPVAALDQSTRGSYVLVNAARAAGVDRIILASTLDLFERLPTHWRVDETWRPRPSPALAQLCPWLAELSVRENARLGRLQAVCLRFGTIVDDATATASAFDPSWVHLDDAVQALHAALRYNGPRRPDWAVFHIMAAGPRAKLRLVHSASGKEAFGYRPIHDFAAHWSRQNAAPSNNQRRPWREFLAPPQPIRSRPIRTVTIYGAGGPMGAATTQELLSSYTLRATDLRPIAEIAAEAKPQAPGAPLPVPVPPPHENLIVDVRDSSAVLAAAAGADALINCTVVRPHPVDAFLVNTVGAYNVMTAAVARRIRRVVQTGPLLQHVAGPGDYLGDYDLHVDAPARPYNHLYIHSKYLGQEICRVFADYYDLEVPVLLFALLANPDIPTQSSPFMISWPDTGRALRRALEAVTLPAPYVMVNISADLPHGRFDHAKAYAVLGWQPRDTMDDFWQDALCADSTS